MADIFVWSIYLCLMELFAMKLLWIFNVTLCTLYRDLFYWLGIDSAGICYIYVIIANIGLKDTYLWTSKWELLQYGWVPIIVWMELTAVWVSGRVQNAACNHLSLPLYTASFLLVFTLLTLFTLFCVLNVPHFFHSTALGFKRARFIRYLDHLDGRGVEENDYP